MLEANAQMQKQIHKWTNAQINKCSKQMLEANAQNAQVHKGSSQPTTWSMDRPLLVRCAFLMSINWGPA